MHMSSWNVPVNSCPIVIKHQFSRDLRKKNTQISHFISIRPVATELFHVDRRRDVTQLTVAYLNLPTRLKLNLLEEDY